MLKKQLREKRYQINITMTAEEKKRLVHNARKFALGNISEWIRYASLELTPKKKDFFDI